MAPSSSPALIEELFAAFGGCTDLSRALSESDERVSVQTVHSWKSNVNGVPRWRRLPILLLAKEKEIALPEHLVEYLDPQGKLLPTAPSASAEKLADAGIASSAQHAEAVRPGWGSDALGYVAWYAAGTADEFMSEDVKAWAYERGLDRPANEGAWGSVMRTANRRKLIKFVGYATAKNETRHGTPSRLWRRA